MISYKYHQVVNKSDTNQILEAFLNNLCHVYISENKVNRLNNAIALKLFVPTKLASLLVSYIVHDTSF